ncbi:peptidase S28 [Xylogone sp. PMI_703]|nr:peptidase S28 [Xylogone sp. PMI_703]
MQSDPAKQYETLTLDNVMLDSVKFIQHIKSTTKGVTQSTPAIILGSSYGGFLSQVIRLNHPETFFGSVAWAAPVRGFGPDRGNPDRSNWINHVTNVYLDQSVVAAQKIKNALQEFDTKSSDPNTLPKDIVSELSICSKPTNQTEYRSLLLWLVNTYSDVTQYFLKTPFVLPVDAFPKLVNATETASNTSGILNAAVRIKTTTDANCTDWTSQGFIDALANVKSYFALIYKYYPITGNNNISNSTIFPASVSQSFTDVLRPVCPSTYNVSLSSILTQEALQRKYHFTQADIESSQRILFPMGEWDPVGSIGPKPFSYPGTPKYTDRNASRAWVVNMMSHGEDSLSPVKGDKESIVHVRKVELQGIKEWLGL